MLPLLLAAQGLTSAYQYGFNGFKEVNFEVTTAPEFLARCVPKWQEDCRKVYAHNKELTKLLCETQLGRNYVKIRTMVDPAEIIKQWKWDKARRDYDVGWVRKEFPKYSKTGAKYMRLPAEMHTKMQDWYRRHRKYAVPEGDQPAFGYNCNTGYDNDDWVVAWGDHASAEDLKLVEDVREWIRKQLSDFTGEDVNELTAIYGAREYHRGSVCAMHTDQMETHAFSAIYQLDQQGMDEPWALDYVTHQGVAERIFMKPGDIVLYEGASMLHGRKDPLKGDYFANIFFHFRSTSWLPAVKQRLDRYWQQRGAYVAASHNSLTSLGEAPKIQRFLSSKDQCFPLRTRTNPLMPEGKFMELPAEDKYDPAAFSKGNMRGSEGKRVQLEF